MFDHSVFRADQPAEEKITAEEEPSIIEQATSAAAEELQRLALDGAAKVTNVKVTTDEREVVRRTHFFEKMTGMHCLFRLVFVRRTRKCCLF